jgi:hypothetical protein
MLKGDINIYLLILMNNIDLDLNINNYTLPDLERFLQLKAKYTYSDVELNESKIRDQLLKSGLIDKRFKGDLITFLETAKRWILAAKFEKVTPTTIPKNRILDPYSNLPTSELLPTSRSENLIQRPDTQFIHTKSDEFFPGTLNPLNTRVITKCLNIDTRFRENMFQSQSSDFLLQLPFKLNKVVSMQLSAIELPISFYGISASYGNNQFQITIFQDPLCECESFSKTIIIPDGNYNASDLINTINNCLHDNDDIFSSIQFILDIKESGSGTGKIKIEPIAGCSDDIIQEIIIDFNPTIDNCNQSVNTTHIGINLGFLKSRYSGAINYISDTLIEPASIRYVYLAINDYNNSANDHFISAFNNSILQPNILARISIKGGYFSLVMENDFSIISEPRKYFGPVDIQKLHIRLLDEHGRIIQMNNANYSFCLNFKILYDL